MSKIITPELITQLLQGALLPVAGAVGQSAVMIGREWINYWKMKNAVCIGEKAKEYLKQRGITDETQVRTLTAKFGVLFLQGASVEDEPSLQDLWAKLLANALDPNYNSRDLKPIFFEIIKTLDPNDVKMLNQIYLLAQKIEIWGTPDITQKLIYIAPIRESLGFSDDEGLLSFQSLSKVGCITSSVKVKQKELAYSSTNSLGQKQILDVYLSLGDQAFFFNNAWREVHQRLHCLKHLSDILLSWCVFLRALIRPFTLHSFHRSNSQERRTISRKNPTIPNTIAISPYKQNFRKTPKVIGPHSEAPWEQVAARMPPKRALVYIQP